CSDAPRFGRQRRGRMPTMCAMGGIGRARVGFAVLAALLLAAAGRPVWAASLSPSLTLAPVRGPASSPVRMTFDFVFVLLCPGGQAVTFSWDGGSRTVATAQL